jgi:hypothetical protein
MSSLELVKTKNSEFKEEYPNLIKTIKNKQLREYEPKIDEIDKVYKIIIDFIKEKQRKIYGGYALNLLLSVKDKKMALYDETDIKTADIDFYSPNALDDLVELCNKISDAGFKPVTGQEAQHKETYSIFVNYRLYCDITYIPNNIYKKSRFIQIDGFNVIHPWFMMIDYFRMFTDPMISYWRLEKHFERYMLIQKTYQLPLIKKPLILAPYKKPEIIQAIDLIFDFITNKETILLTGFYIYNYYLYESNYRKNNKNYEFLNMPYLEAYSIDYIKDGLDILDFVKSLPENISSKITYKEYYPFFQFYGHNFVLYFDDGTDTFPILYCYSNNKRCVPYKQVDCIKFSNNNSPLVDNKKKINIGSFDHNILHALIILVKIRVDDDNDWNDVLYKYINGLVAFRNYYLETKKKTIYSDTVFQEFVIDCMGETISPDRERRLVIEIRKKLGKPYVFKYDPNVSKKVGHYVFMNSSGNQITKDSDMKLKKENLSKKIMDELEDEELSGEHSKQKNIKNKRINSKKEKSENDNIDNIEDTEDIEDIEDIEDTEDTDNVDYNETDVL